MRLAIGQLIPNSPEFSVLNYWEKFSILHTRATKAGTLLPEVEDEPDAKESWYYDTDEEALANWRNDTHLARCTTQETQWCNKW